LLRCRRDVMSRRAQWRWRWRSVGDQAGAPCAAESGRSRCRRWGAGLRTQATSYIPSHLHLANNHTYTPYDQRYCPSCRPLQIVGNEPHTLLHCPHSSPLSHPAILSLTRALRRYNLCSWSSHTPPQQTAILLGSRPPKLLRKHDKAWTHITSTICTQLIYSLQFHFSKHLPSSSPGPIPSLISSLASPPSDDTQCQVCQSPLTRKECFSVT